MARSELGIIAVACAFSLVGVRGLASPALKQPISDPTLVQIDSGKVRGVAADDVISFKGIPYAAPPVGDLRWRVPQAVEPWLEVRMANQFGAECMQADPVPKSEDCLFLNVWKPAAASSQPLPVMVWIYGGALAHGQTSLYPADRLAAQGVIVVSMNYRMGRLGFFAHPALAQESPTDVQGNYGHMDQLAALKWVQRNIAAFGGDPKQVTIFGESAGGGSVMVHLTSPLSRGLFQRAILQSPGLPAARSQAIPLTDLAKAEQMAVDYSRSVGVTGDGADALSALRAIPAETLIEGASSSAVLAGMSAGKPVIGVTGAIRDGRLIVDTPETILATQQQTLVPVLVGANDYDLGIGTVNSKDEAFALFGAYADEARRLYDPYGDQTVAEIRQQVLADKTMVEPARHLANEMARSGQPVWFYRYAYVFQGFRGRDRGTRHGFEIPFVFNIPEAVKPLAEGIPDFAITPSDREMAALTSAYWVQFGKTGDPNGAGRPIWPRHDPAVDRLMQFTNSGIIVGTDPLKQHLDLWQKLWDSAR